MSLDTQLLRDSFALVVEREPELTARFYTRLFADYPQSRALFGGRSERAQQTMLRDALVAVIEHLDDAPWLQGTLRALGAAHVGYGVTTEMYDWVGQASSRRSPTSRATPGRLASKRRGRTPTV